MVAWTSLVTILRWDAVATTASRLTLSSGYCQTAALPFDAKANCSVTKVGLEPASSNGFKLFRRQQAFSEIKWTAS